MDARFTAFVFADVDQQRRGNSQFASINEDWKKIAWEVSHITVIPQSHIRGIDSSAMPAMMVAPSSCKIE